VASTKAGVLSGQVGRQGWQARSIEVAALSANIFDVVTDRTNKTKLTDWLPLSSLLFDVFPLQM
jgi:hypothetical protein